MTSDVHCYILFTEGRKMNVSNKTNMHMIINNSSMVPIYEQLVNRFKKAISQGELLTDTMLSSVRTLSNE